MALKDETKITMQILENVIKKVKPSISIHELKKYELQRAKMNSENTEEKNDRPRIGFKPNN